mmetsp:Transcript_23135/g.22605  ORF Transcript_23135/g.22605 Transcript_23135/m.22605 type:complete len:146 (-) Transcript_23135:1113-1550(-)
MVAHHSSTISQVAFDERGFYLITMGGFDKLSLAVWKIKDLIDLFRKNKSMCCRNEVPVCELMIGSQKVSTLKVDNRQTDMNTLNLAMGTEKGFRFYTVNIQEREIEEKKVSHQAPIYSIAFQGEEMTIGTGDNGQLYQFCQEQVT